MRIRACIFSAMLLAAPLFPARGQALWLANGHRIELPPLPARVENGAISIPSGGSFVRVPLANILRLEWPLPPAFASAADDLKLGRAREALDKIGPWLDAQEPLRALPGSLWNAGVSLRAAAFVQLGRVPEADAILASLQAGQPDPVGVARIHLAMAEQWMQLGRTAEARAQLAAVGDGTENDANQARRAAVQGGVLRAEGKIDEALLSYLRVPVYYPRETEQLPPALLGALRCYRALGDQARAARTAERLQNDFTSTPEAAAARLETAPDPKPPQAP